MGLATRGIGPLSPLATSGLGVFGYVYVPVEPPARDRFPGMLILPGLNDTDKAVLLGLGGSRIVEVQNTHTGDADIDLLTLAIRAEAGDLAAGTPTSTPIHAEAGDLSDGKPVSAPIKDSAAYVLGAPIPADHAGNFNPNRQER